MKAGYRAVVLLMAMVGVAQPMAAQNVQVVGVQGGATLNGLTNWETGLFSDGRWGGTAGLFFGRSFNRTADLSLEANWVQMGGPSVRMDYVDIPITIGGGIVGRPGSTNVRLYVGASVGFKVSCNADDAFIDYCDSASGTQWTLPAGLLIGKWLDSGRFLGVDTRFVWGLSDVSDNFKARGQSLQFRLVLGNRMGGG